MGFRSFKVTQDGEEIPNVTSVRVTRVGDAESNAAEITLDNYNGRAMDSSGGFQQRVDSILKIYAAEGFVDVNKSSHLLDTYFV